MLAIRVQYTSPTNPPVVDIFYGQILASVTFDICFGQVKLISV